jgi:hypothetical protein
VWQAKELGDFGRRGERRRQGERTEPVRLELTTKNIHYYNMDVNRDCGSVRTGDLSALQHRTKRSSPSKTEDGAPDVNQELTPNIHRLQVQFLWYSHR